MVSYVRGGLAVATYRSVLITCVREQIDLGYLAAAHRIGKSLAARHRGRIGSLTLISPNMKLPTAEVRAQATKNTKEADAWVAAGATVVGGEGFVASAIRGALIAATLFEGGPPRRVFADSHAACEWLARRIGAGADQLDPLAAWSTDALSDRYEQVFAKAG